MENRFETFTYLIFKMTKLIQKIKSIEMAELGLKAVHVMCIYHLYKYKDGLTSKRLVELTLEDKAAISRAIADLKKKGLIDYEGKYNSLIRLNDEGIKAALFIEGKSNEALGKSSISITDEERRQLYISLRKIEGNIESYYKEIVEGKNYEG